MSRYSTFVALLAIMALATMVSAQRKPHKPSGIPDQSRPWPINWTLQARVREECLGSNKNGTERFFTLFYSSLTNQLRADVTYGTGINTYTQYFAYANGTGAIFFNASPSGAAHCELVKPGTANTNAFLLPRNWTAAAKWAGQTSIDGKRVNAWLGSDYGTWWGTLFGCNLSQISYVYYESIDILPKPVRIEFFRGPPKPNWDETDVVMLLPLVFLESGFFDFHKGVFNYGPLINNYCK